VLQTGEKAEMDRIETSVREGGIVSARRDAVGMLAQTWRGGNCSTSRHAGA